MKFPTQTYSRQDLDSLRAGLVHYLQRTGTHLVKQGSRLVGLCPNHDDRHPSFAVFGDRLDTCGCYPCGFTGDVFSLVRWLGRAGSFREAVQHVADVLGEKPEPEVWRRDRSSRAGRASAPVPKSFDAEMIHRARLEFSDRFWAEDTALSGLIQSLRLPREAFRWAAWGASGLGWAKGSICYAYPTGLKWRNPSPECRPRFRWLTGKAAAPWRADLIKPETERVILTEGESDTLAIVAAGIEADGRTVACASPGASFEERWARLFTGKDVVVWFDDEPSLVGAKAAESTAAILHPVASSIRLTPKHHTR